MDIVYDPTEASIFISYSDNTCYVVWVWEQIEKPEQGSRWGVNCLNSTKLVYTALHCTSFNSNETVSVRFWKMFGLLVVSWLPAG